MNNQYNAKLITVIIMDSAVQPSIYSYIPRHVTLVVLYLHMRLLTDDGAAI